jgi:hypothetical protein
MGTRFSVAQEVIMKKALIAGLIVSVAGAVAMFWNDFGRSATAAGADQQPLAHNVYFSLKDNSAAAKKKLVAACKKYLSKHAGEMFFGAGTLAADLDRPVNDRDFDVGLHIIFKDRASHDKYQDAPRHKQFIEENKDNWSKVRVFDSVLN